MSRMDVQTKLLLMKLYESYWLMLPYELQEYILVYKINQEVIEERKKERSVMLCNEIVKRHQLKEAWGLGPVRCRIIKCKQSTHCHYCTHYPSFFPLSRIFNRVLHFKFYGEYSDSNERVFLGDNMVAARRRVNHVKSFL